MEEYIEQVRIKGMAMVDYDTISKEDLSNFKWFVINYQNQKKVIITSKAIHTNDISLKQLDRDGKVAFLEKDYAKCLELYQQLLLFDKSTRVFKRITMCYYHLNKYKFALDYLKVADSLEKNFELDSFIKNIEMDMLQRKIRKTALKFNINDIDNIEEIINLYQNNVDFETIFTKFKMNDDQRSLLYIAFAREYYHLNLNMLGDKYLNLAEKQLNKSKFTNLLIDEVRRNKLFYQYKDVPVLLTRKINK